MVVKYGQDVVDDLESLEFTTKAWKRDELEALRDDYRVKIKQLKQGILPDGAEGKEHETIDKLLLV